MSKNVVNLDALIPREDFAVDRNEHKPSASSIEKIDIHHLDYHFFIARLRKPDFQRETAQWSPNKVVDLIKAFINGDLIPAVILWQSGDYIFVIDGSHRLSALIAWVKDDYGDQRQSLEFFGNRISGEQRNLADKTRNIVKAQIGTYGELFAATKKPENASAATQKKASNLAVNYVTAQWVSAVDAKAAEDSFFKINQAATPIDTTELRILQARKSPNAIAARAITRAGTGHKYWSDFNVAQREEIEILGRQIYHALYDPPMGEGPIKTLDLPVAGRGYNALPFAFDLVNQVNEVRIADSTKSKHVDKEKLPEDIDGSKTVEFLSRVRRFIYRITGTSPASLGPHPAIYFYTAGGAFQPAAFLAFVFLVDWLEQNQKMVAFTEGRKELEDFLVRNKSLLGDIAHKYGSGARSVSPIFRYFKEILKFVWNGKKGQDIEMEMGKEGNFQFLFSPRPTNRRVPQKSGGKEFQKKTKSAAFMTQALASVPRCQLCGGLMHLNSMQVDHITRMEEGGGAEPRNAQMTHPFCNSSR